MSQDKRLELAKLLEAATPGPWLLDTDAMYCPTVYCGHESGFGGGIAQAEDPYPRGANSPAESMELIVAMHAALPWLLADSERLEQIRQAFEFYELTDPSPVEFVRRVREIL